MASNLPILRTATLRGAIRRRTTPTVVRQTPTVVGQTPTVVGPNPRGLCFDEPKHH